MLREATAMVALLEMPVVQTELKLADEQRARVEELRLARLPKLRDLMQRLAGLTPPERNVAVTAFRDGEEKDASALLEPAQTTRLRQLLVQREGPRSLGRADVAADLMLSPEQQEKIAAALQEERLAAIRRRPAGRPELNAGNPIQQQAAQRAARAATEKTLTEVLTPAQTERFRSLQGTRFEFPPEAVPGVTQRPREGNLKVGDTAPDFSLTDLEGRNPTRLSGFQGKKPVVLVFGSIT